MAAATATLHVNGLEPQENTNGVYENKKLESSSETKHYNDWPNERGLSGSPDVKIPVALKVSGHIPSYCAGTLYRTGPGSYEVTTVKNTIYSQAHWFDGFSQVHRFQIIPAANPGESATVLYNSRTSVDKLIEQIRLTGKLDDFTFARKREPCQSYFKKFMTAFQPIKKTLPDEDNIGVTMTMNMPGLKSFSKINGANANNEDPKGHASGVIKTLWTKTDTSQFKQIHPETLEPIGIASQESLHPDLKGPMAAAHAKSCPITGDVFNFNLAFVPMPTYRVFRVDASTGQTTILASFIDAPPAYLHSLFLTENYVVLCIWGSHMKRGGVDVLWNRNILDSIMPSDKSKPVLWYVISRHGEGVVAKFESPMFFSFHTVNAFEVPAAEDDSDGIFGTVDIVADIPVYPNMDVLHRLYYDNIRSSSSAVLPYRDPKNPLFKSTQPELHRYKLGSVPLPAPRTSTTSTPSPTNMPAAKSRRLSSFSGRKQSSASSATPTPKPRLRKAEQLVKVIASSTPELPTFHPGFVTKRHRYIYGISDRGLSSFFDSLVKLDMENPEAEPLRWEERGCTPGEAIFIPAPRQGVEDVVVDEDSGTLLCVVLDGLKGTSFLLVLDPKTMKEVGRATMEVAVALGFHGLHFPAGQAAVESEAIASGRALDL